MIDHVTLLESLAASGQDVLTGGRYLDRYERRAGMWRIAERTFVADWTMAQPAGAGLDPIYQPERNRDA